jgi:hypothetical protein
MSNVISGHEVDSLSSHRPDSHSGEMSGIQCYAGYQLKKLQTLVESHVHSADRVFKCGFPLGGLYPMKR